MRLGVIGSRRYPNRYIAEETIRRLAVQQPGIAIVSGGGEGVEAWVVEEARRCGLSVTEFKPDPETYGDRAEAEQKTLIAEVAQGVLAFWDGQSKETLDRLRQVKALDKQIRIVMPDGSEPMPYPV